MLFPNLYYITSTSEGRLSNDSDTKKSVLSQRTSAGWAPASSERMQLWSCRTSKKPRDPRGDPSAAMCLLVRPGNSEPEKHHQQSSLLRRCPGLPSTRQQEEESPESQSQSFGLRNDYTTRGNAKEGISWETRGNQKWNRRRERSVTKREGSTETDEIRRHTQISAGRAEMPEEDVFPGSSSF